MSIDSAAYRSIIGNFATGVTVVTTDVDGMLHGMTANAVTSVSLDPLLLLVCVDKDAVAHAQMLEATAFGVSILGAGQRDVSNAFASSGAPEQGSLRGFPFHTGSTGVPLLDGVVASLECEAHDRLDAGDHTVFLGKVAAGSVDSDDPPLLYFRGKYGEVAV